jgi:acyl-CoA thioesterase I
LPQYYKKKQIRFLNTAVAADKINDLKNRWQKDCLNLEPDVVSILVGINDVIGGHFWKSPTTIKSFEEDYRFILEQTHDIIGAKIILLNPFIIYRTKQQCVYKILLDRKINVISKLSKEFNTVLIPLDRIFDEASKHKDPTLWSEDGRHPTAIGHTLIAQSWIKGSAEIFR